MSGEDDQEKTEQPTERRLREAVEQGRIPVSRDLAMASVLLVGVAQFHLFGKAMFDELGAALRHGLAFADVLIRDAPLPAALADFFSWPLTLVLIFSAPLAAAAIGAQWSVAGGLHLVWGNLAFKPERLSPAAGLARMFGAAAAIELLKSIAKTVAIGAIGYGVLSAQIEALTTLSFIPIERGVLQAGALTLALLAWLVGASALLGLLDAILQWRRHRSRLLMSRQEMKDEHKQNEGSPEVKQRMRRLQQEMTQRGSVAQVERAQVVIVNPTHYAVALHYDFEEGAAPRVLAKGSEQVALSIREKAEERGIPVLSIPLLARAVYYTSDIGAEIHADLYRAVATVLSFVLQAGAQGETPDVEIPEQMRFDSNGRRLETSA